MVTLRFKPERLVEISGMDLDVVLDSLFLLKGEVELKDNYVYVELNPDRPDMFMSEGIARAVRGINSVELGWRAPQVGESGITVINEMPSTRPFIAAAALYNVNLDEDQLEEVIQFQEKLHDTIGRHRRKVAIGLHDLSKVKSRTLRYSFVPLSYKMVPLDNNREMSVEEVLRSTEQGKLYGSISRQESLHPAFLDEAGLVLSLPPVINSELTRIQPGTRDLLIDVTGTDLPSVLKTLDIIVTTLSEGKRSSIGYVNIINPGSQNLRTPSLNSKYLKLSSDYVNRVLGTSLNQDEVALSLLKMRYNVKATGEGLLVEVPPFRYDIISEVDLVEDVAMAVGYESPTLSPNRRPIESVGSLQRSTLLARASRNIMVGLGFTEILSFILTSSSLLRITGLVDSSILIRNPVQQDLDSLRPSLIPQLLDFMRANLDKEKPIKVFEIGKVVYRSGDTPVEDLRMAAAIMDETVSFEDIQSVAYAYLRSLGLSPSSRASELPMLIRGRSATLLSNGTDVGIIGEVNPEVLEKLKITYPVAVFELSLASLLRALKDGNTGPQT